MYRFEKINDDTYKLITDKKEFTFTRTVDIAKITQKVDVYTTAYLAEFLDERGETFENTTLKKTRTVGNQTIVDESALNAVKEEFRKMAYYDVMNVLFKKLFNTTYLEVIGSLGIDLSKNEEVSKFITEFTNIIVNGMKEDTPRKQD